jgi:hypothetical protein
MRTRFVSAAVALALLWAAAARAQQAAPAFDAVVLHSGQVILGDLRSVEPGKRVVIVPRGGEPIAFAWSEVRSVNARPNRRRHHLGRRWKRRHSSPNAGTGGRS